MFESRRFLPRLAVLLLLLPAISPGLFAQTILYDQNGPPSGNGIPDQNFEDEFDSFDSEAADDFEVTGEYGWDLQLIRTVGTTDGNGGGKVNVKIYANTVGGGNPDLPGAVVCSYNQLSSTTFPSLELALPTPCHLPLGRYWLSVQVDQDYASHGQHFWSNTRNQHGSEGVWSNPLDGFERNCRSFKPQTQCLVGGANNPDLIFQLVGLATPPPTTDVVLDLSGELPTASIFVQYELKVSNHGPLDASGMVVSQTLPSGCVFERDTCGGLAAGGWQWNLGNLAKGATATCQVTCDIAGVPAGQPLMSTATVRANQVFTHPAMASDAVQLIAGPAPAIPVASPAGLTILAALLALAGAFLLRRF